MSALVIVEHDNTALHPSTFNTVTAARLLSEEISLLIAGHRCHALAEQAAGIEGVTEVILADHQKFEYATVLAESMAPLVVHHASAFSYLLAPASAFGKNTLPRIAALLDVSQLSDVIAILGNNTYQRPFYAGDAIETVRLLDKQQVMTVRPIAFAPARQLKKEETRLAKIVMSEFLVDNRQSEFVSLETPSLDRPCLATAGIVISGGRGLQNLKNFQRLSAIADKMGAAVGASRAAVDAGFAPNDCQVGQTGQVVAPKLYIAVGISGAVQHLSGMKDSKVIVAINKDPEAPIFQVADYKLVADINNILSEWEAMFDDSGSLPSS